MPAFTIRVRRRLGDALSGSESLRYTATANAKQGSAAAICARTVRHGIGSDTVVYHKANLVAADSGIAGLTRKQCRRLEYRHTDQKQGRGESAAKWANRALEAGFPPAREHRTMLVGPQEAQLHQGRDCRRLVPLQVVSAAALQGLARGTKCPPQGHRAPQQGTLVPARKARWR